MAREKNKIEDEARERTRIRNESLDTAVLRMLRAGIPKSTIARERGCSLSRIRRVEREGARGLTDSSGCARTPSMDPSKATVVEMRAWRGTEDAAKAPQWVRDTVDAEIAKRDREAQRRVDSGTAEGTGKNATRRG